MVGPSFNGFGIILWNLNCVPIGLSAEPTSHELLSASHMKGLELRERAEELVHNKTED